MTDRRWRLGGSVLRADLDGGAVLYDSEARRFHELNATAAAMLALLEDGATLAEVAAAVADVYGIEREAAARQAQEVLEHLLHLGVLAPR